MKPEVDVSRKGLGEPVQVVLWTGEVAGGEVESHCFDAFTHQTLAESELKRVVGRGAAFPRRIRFASWKSLWPGQRLIQTHPGVEQQAPVDLLGRQPKVVGEDLLGEGAAGSGRVGAV